MAVETSSEEVLRHYRMSSGRLLWSEPEILQRFDMEFAARGWRPTVFETDSRGYNCPALLPVGVRLQKYEQRGYFVAAISPGAFWLPGFYRAHLSSMEEAAGHAQFLALQNYDTRIYNPYCLEAARLVRRLRQRFAEGSGDYVYLQRQADYHAAQAGLIIRWQIPDKPWLELQPDLGRGKNGDGMVWGEWERAMKHIHGNESLDAR